MIWVWLVAGIVMTVPLVAYWVRLRAGRVAGGFQDYVRNPDYRRAVSDHFQARQNLTVPETLSTAQIEQMVSRLFVQDDHDLNFERLKLAGTKTVQFLIAAIANPRTKSHTFENVENALDPKSPFERLASLLAHAGVKESSNCLVPFLDHPDLEFRRVAVRAIGGIASDDSIDAFFKALDDEETRSSALNGLQHGLRAGRYSTEFRDRVFPVLESQLHRPDCEQYGIIAKLMLEVDRDRALNTLLTENHISTDNNRVHHILKALNDAHVVIPHSLLLPLITAVGALSQKPPHTQQFAQTLIAYARNPDETTANLLQDSLQSPIERIQDAAAKAQAILGGVENAREFVIEQWQRGGLDSLSPPQKLYLAVTTYDSEINNGGHLQYFVNSSGDIWKEAIKGLEVLSAERRSYILKDAAAQFGVNGPSEDIASRRKQLERLSPKQKETFLELDRRWFASEDHLPGLLTQFAVQHREVFSARPGGLIE